MRLGSSLHIKCQNVAVILYIYFVQNLNEKYKATTNGKEQREDKPAS